MISGAAPLPEGLAQDLSHRPPGPVVVPCCCPWVCVSRGRTKARRASFQTVLVVCTTWGPGHTAIAGEETVDPSFWRLLTFCLSSSFWPVSEGKAHVGNWEVKEVTATLSASGVRAISARLTRRVNAANQKQAAGRPWALQQPAGSTKSQDDAAALGTPSPAGVCFDAVAPTPFCLFFVQHQRL